MKCLCALSALTGDKKYKKAALKAMRYFLRNEKGRKLLLGDPQGRKELPSGLLPWGGHAFYDLEADRVSGKLVHELKNHSPYYDLMWEADKKRTARFIKAFWRNHIYDWRNLEFNRHSDSGHKAPDDKDFWSANKDKYKGGPLPMSSETGSFFHSGSDLFYAAACYYKFSGDKDALLWAKRLAGRYMEARDKKTGLGGDMLGWKKDKDPDAPGPLDGLYPGLKVVGDTVWDTRYHFNAVSRMRIYEMLGRPMPNGPMMKKIILSGVCLQMGQR
jgi:hypothetical protein